MWTPDVRTVSLRKIASLLTLSIKIKKNRKNPSGSGVISPISCRRWWPDAKERESNADRGDLGDIQVAQPAGPFDLER